MICDFEKYYGCPIYRHDLQDSSKFKSLLRISKQSKKNVKQDQEAVQYTTLSSLNGIFNDVFQGVSALGEDFISRGHLISQQNKNDRRNYISSIPNNYRHDQHEKWIFKICPGLNNYKLVANKLPIEYTKKIIMTCSIVDKLFQI